MVQKTRRHGTWRRATRTWLVAVLLGLLALAMQVGTVSADSPQITINPGSIGAFCETHQCIGSVQVSPHGQFADIGFHTSFAGVGTVQVSTVAPNKLANGDWSYSGLPVASFALSPAGTQHGVELGNLQPNTAYHFLVNATKGSTGDDAQYHGTFTTLKRYVKATVTEIDVTDDSDDLSAGDLVFNLDVNGSSPAIFPSAETTQWPTSEAKTVNMQSTGVSGDVVTVRLKGWDWDDDQQGWLIGAPITIGSANTSGIDGDGANAVANINVAGDGHDQAFSMPITLQTSNHALKFTAFGSIQIFYAP